jgi:hypothetical protein
MHWTPDPGLTRERQRKALFRDMQNLVDATTQRPSALAKLLQLARIKRFHRARSTVPSPKGPFV